MNFRSANSKDTQHDELLAHWTIEANGPGKHPVILMHWHDTKFQQDRIEKIMNQINEQGMEMAKCLIEGHY